MKPALALFDLDHTLIRGDTQSEWGHYLADCGILDLAFYKKRMLTFEEGYRQGKLDISALLAFHVEILRPFSLEKINAWRSDFTEKRIPPLIVNTILKQLLHHQAQGDQVILVTATSEFLTLPIAELLGIKHLIALKEECDAHGRHTGRVLGTPSYREGKIIRLQEWLIEKHTSLEDFDKVWFYSDSHNDLPLLSFVTNPVAVNPDQTLREYANNKRWPIIDFEIAP
jgi:HAD superfamily hydrolase (TIGR01490 family)